MSRSAGAERPAGRTPGAASSRFFSHPMRPTLVVARENGITGLPGVILSTLPGRLAWAMHLRRRVPARVAQARRAEFRGSSSTSRLVVSNERSDYRAGVLVGVAPGDRLALADLIDSIRRYEGDDIKVVVADDLTGDYPDAYVAAAFPGVDFVRPGIAAGTGIAPAHALQPALLHLVEHYGLPAVLKCDPDSLVVGSGAFDEAIERFASRPQVGIVGRTVFDSVPPVDPRWVIWMAHPELRWSRGLRRLVGAAAAAVPRLDFAQGGACFFSGAAVAAAIECGLFPYRQPQWSLQGHDVLIGLILQAAGFTVEPFGDSISTDTDRLLFDPPELLARGAKIVHSVRGSPSGLDEAAIRAFFRAAREAEPVAH